MLFVLHQRYGYTKAFKSCKIKRYFLSPNKNTCIDFGTNLTLICIIQKTHDISLFSFISMVAMAYRAYFVFENKVFKHTSRFKRPDLKATI